ncbi:hypothetical protein ACQKQD_11845 [Methylobacterium sp. NPDC080182]|uniref:hypothetical protein n=1 Tax=Methylobacterium sp. NPDC080182 TaxID=3390590 RepID=UPI003D010908
MPTGYTGSMKRVFDLWRAWEISALQNRLGKKYFFSSLRPWQNPKRICGFFGGECTFVNFRHQEIKLLVLGG